MLKRDDVRDMIGYALRQAIPYERAPLDRKRVDAIMEMVRVRLAKEFGVTVQQDESGAWGLAGSHTVTLRCSHPKDEDDRLTIGLTLDFISSSKADDLVNADNRATPQ